jgi:hypothetical protein
MIIASPQSFRGWNAARKRSVPSTRPREEFLRFATARPEMFENSARHRAAAPGVSEQARSQTSSLFAEADLTPKSNLIGHEKC